ncbi:MAG: hypothetical protein JWM59_3727 [Verrucomicrobiales bacterium]|nr:hypothetical protein [Verrucomicrobiales bacterium]
MKRRIFLALLAAPRLFGKPPTWANMKAEVFHMEDNYGSWEEFKIGGASYNLHTQGHGTREFTVKISCSGSLKRTPELVEVYGESMPGFEATAVLSSERLALKAGEKIIQRESYDRKRSENLSWFTYGGSGAWKTCGSKC